MQQIITHWDWLLLPFYILIIAIVATRIKNKYIKKNPIYKYFLWGLYAKIFGAICVCLIYVYYYKEGGDTLMYNRDSTIILNLLWHSPKDFFTVWLSPLTKETMSVFTKETGYLAYRNDPNAFMVSRLIIPLKFISFDTYLISSILMAVLSYTGIWKLYLVFCDYYPLLYKQFAITVLFVPSVVFWGSGLLKDSWTLAAVGWYCYSFYKIFIKPKELFFQIVSLILSSLILISIKPYIFIALLPGSLLWASWSKIVLIKNNFLRIVIVPVMLSLGLGIGFFIWTIVSPNLGHDYSSIDNMIAKAHVSYEDLKQDYYQGNSFDLGAYEPTLAGVLSKFPIAVMTGLFRPFIWEAKNIVMIVSGMEDLIILLIVVSVFIRKPIVALTNLFKKPIVLFSLIFAIFFAFSVAISTSNFGALVRLRIPQIPFLLSGLVIVNYKKETVIHEHKASYKFVRQ